MGSGIENPCGFAVVGAGTSEAGEFGADDASDGDAGAGATSMLSSAGRDDAPRLWARAGLLPDRGAKASVVAGFLPAEAAAGGAASIGTISGPVGGVA